MLAIDTFLIINTLYTLLIYVEFAVAVGKNRAEMISIYDEFFKNNVCLSLLKSLLDASSNMNIITHNSIINDPNMTVNIPFITNDFIHKHKYEQHCNITTPNNPHQQIQITDGNYDFGAWRRERSVVVFEFENVLAINTTILKDINMTGNDIQSMEFDKILMCFGGEKRIHMLDNFLRNDIMGHHTTLCVLVTKEKSETIFKVRWLLS